MDQAKPFLEVLKTFDAWCEEHHLSLQNLSPESRSYIFITCGDSDFKAILREQCKASEIDIPEQFQRWANLDVVYHRSLLFMGGNWAGIDNQLKAFNLTFEGKPHSGIRYI